MFVEQYVSRELETAKALIKLEGSKYPFFLTGSRYFGGSNHNSDYDFYTQHDANVEEFLQDLGFENLADEDYEDSQVSIVYRLGKIDIQLVKDVYLKRAAHYIVDRKLVHKNNDTVTRNTEWNRAYKIAQKVVEILR